MSDPTQPSPLRFQVVPEKGQVTLLRFTALTADRTHLPADLALTLGKELIAAAIRASAPQTIVQAIPPGTNDTLHS